MNNLLLIGTSSWLFSSVEANFAFLGYCLVSFLALLALRLPCFDWGGLHSCVDSSNNCRQFFNFEFASSKVSIFSGSGVAGLSTSHLYAAMLKLMLMHKQKRAKQIAP